MSIENIGEPEKARPKKKESRRAKRDSQETATSKTKRNGKKTPALELVRDLAPNEHAVVTVIESVAPDRLSKRYSLAPDGSLVKESAGEMREGVATIASAANVTALAALIGRLQPNQALTYGIPSGVLPHHESDPEGDHDPMGSWDVVTKSEVERARARDPDRTRSLVSRTRDCFAWPNGPGVMMLDYDVDAGEETLGRDALYAAIVSAAPWLSDVQMLHVPSSSSHIYNAETGDEIQGLRGQRLYIIVSDASEIPHLGTALVNALWGHGLGRIVLSRGPGRMLERTLVDSSVWQPERLDFAAGAVCESPLEQRHRVPTVIGGEAEAFDVSLLDGLLDTLRGNAVAAATARESAKAAKKPASVARASSWADERTDERLSAEPDATPARRKAVREQYLRAVEGTMLEPDFVLHVCDESGGNPSPVAVREILDDPKRYNGRLTLDPLEPDYDGGRIVGKIFIGHDEKIRLHSFAHGTTTHALVDRMPEVKRPSWRTHGDWTCFGAPGLYYHTEREDTHGNVFPVDTRLCSPIEVIARPVGVDGTNTGKALRWRHNVTGETRTGAVRMAELQTTDGCARTLAKLSGEGVEGLHGRNRPAFFEWLLSDVAHMSVPKGIALDGYGWQTLGKGRRVFALPCGEVIGDDAGEAWMLSDDRAPDGFGYGGDAEAWREGVAEFCRGNPLLLTSVSLALAGPLLELVGVPSIGLHLWGDSSKGKSTALHAAASVWGRPDPGLFVSWEATPNGLEARAIMQSHMLLPVDEIGNADPDKVGAVVYRLLNGIGKARATHVGGAAKQARWRCALLSSGEHTLAAHMATGARRSGGTKAGQEVRLLSVYGMREFGVFDDVHGQEPRDLAEAINRACASHYGHAGPAFVRMLLREGTTAEEVREGRDRAREYLLGEAGGEAFDGRAAGAFALIAAAGEMASAWGVLPYAAGDVLDAVRSVFAVWRRERGGGSPEDRKAIEGVRAFLDKHSDTRFDPRVDSTDHPARERAGWWEDVPEEGHGARVFYFPKDSLADAVPGMDARRIAQALERKGWIHAHDTGRLTKSVRVRGMGGTHNLYAVRVRDA